MSNTSEQKTGSKLHVGIVLFDDTPIIRDSILEVTVTNALGTFDARKATTLEPNSTITLIDEFDSTSVYSSSVSALLLYSATVDKVLLSASAGSPNVMRAIQQIMMMRPALPSYQRRVEEWLYTTFSNEIASSRAQRNSRFLEEALELVQSCGMTKERAAELVEYVFNRPVGEKEQEVGGAMLTLAGLCITQNINMTNAAEKELAGAWERIDEIREKQRNKVVPDIGPEPEN